MKKSLLSALAAGALLLTLAGCTPTGNTAPKHTKSVPTVSSVPTTRAPEPSNLPTPIPSNSTATYQVPANQPNEAFRIVYTPGQSSTASATYNAANGNGTDILTSCAPAVAGTKGVTVRYTVDTTQRKQHILLSGGAILCNGGVQIVTVIPPFGRAANGLHVTLNSADLQKTAGAYAIGRNR